MSKYFYKAEWNGVTYLRSSNGMYKAAFPMRVRAGKTITSSDASWTFDDDKIAKACGYRITITAVEIDKVEFCTLQKLGQMQERTYIAEENARFQKDWLNKI